MTSLNVSFKVTEFIIDGFNTTKNQIIFGVILGIFYVVAVLANLVNILFIFYDNKLHKPMYLLICNLAVVDILNISSISPTMIGVLVAGVKTISYVPCLLQMFAFNLGTAMEMFALAVMAFDRLLAICCPFHYHSYLTNARTLVLTCILWIVACGIVSVFSVIVTTLPQCSSVIKYTFCDYAALIRTTCVDPNFYFNLIAIVVFSFVFITFGFICLTYVGIIYFVKLSSNIDKKKMRSTCLSHLIVVTTFYLPVFIISVLTRFDFSLTLEARNGLRIGSTFGTCLVNPFVYCLRTKEIKYNIVNMFRQLTLLNRFFTHKNL